MNKIHHNLFIQVHEEPRKEDLLQKGDGETLFNNK